MVLIKFVSTQELGSSLKEHVDLMEASVPSLTYHNHMEFVWEALKLCSKVFDPMTVADERLIAVCQKTVLQLIAHPISDVRWQAYKASLRLSKDAFSVSHVTEPMSTICQKSLFLLDRAVLYQICCFGIYDENDKVNSPCIVYGNAISLFFFLSGLFQILKFLTSYQYFIQTLYLI